MSLIQFKNMYSRKCLLQGLIFASPPFSLLCNSDRKGGALGKTASQVIGMGCLSPVNQYMTINFPLCADFLPEHKAIKSWLLEEIEQGETEAISMWARSYQQRAKAQAPCQ